MRIFLSIAFLFLFVFSLSAQDSVEVDECDEPKEKRERIRLDGEIVSVLITPEGDTLLIADLDDVSVSTPRKFDDVNEYKRYLKYRNYATKVYPYAVDAIRIFRETEDVTQNMKKGKRKKHIKRLNKELKDDFKDPLKKLTRTQGKILIKMIEKELDTPFYNLVKDLRGGVSASYWNQLGKLYGYKMKRGYVEGDDKILDAVLHDFDISHDYK